MKKIFQQRVALIKNKDFLDPSKEVYKKFITRAPFTKEDYEENKKYLDSMDLSQDSSYEKAVINFLGFQIFENPYPPYIGSNSSAKIMVDGKEKSFPDCGETSIRNFINCLLFDPQTQTFNIELLKSLTVNESLINFYIKYNNTLKIELGECYNAWAKLCISIPGVEYREGRDNAHPNGIYNIQGVGAGNLARVLAHFFNIKYVSANQVFEALKINLSKQNITLGRDGKDVISDGFGEETFSVGDKIKFKWIFKDGHFVIDVSSKNLKPQDIFFKIYISNLSNWPLTKRYVIFVSDDNLKKEFISKICSKKNPKEQLFKVSSLLAFMKNENDVIFLIKQIIQKENLDDAYKILVKTSYSLLNNIDGKFSFGEAFFEAKKCEDWNDLLKKIIYDLRNTPEMQLQLYMKIKDLYWSEESSKNLFEVIAPYLKGCFMASNFLMHRLWWTIVKRLLAYDISKSRQHIIDCLRLPNLTFRLIRAIKKDKVLDEKEFLTWLKDKIDSQNKTFNFENLYKNSLLRFDPEKGFDYWGYIDMVITEKYEDFYKSSYDFLKEHEFSECDRKNKIPEKYLKKLEEKMKESVSGGVAPLSQGLLLLKAKLLSLAIQLK